MKLFYRLVLLLILTPLFSSAQSNYKPGYVVNMQGDTISGYINFREWGQNPQSIDFKNTQGEKSEYSYKNIKAFAINGYVAYGRYVVSISMGKVNLADLTSLPDTSTRTDTVFLKQITAGRYLALYSYIDNLKERYYIGDKSNNPVELIQRFYLNDEVSTIVTKKNYLRQLEAYALTYKPGDKKLTDRISAVNYEDVDLQSVVNEINGEYKKGIKNGSGVRFFAGVLLASNSTSFNGNTQFAGDKSSSSFPGVSLGIDVLPNKNVQAFFVRLELAFTQNKANFSNANSSNASTLTLKQSVVDFNPQVMFNIYNASRCKIYLSAGIIVNYSTYANKSYDESFSGFPAVPIEYPDVQSLYFSFSTKIGIQLNNKVEIYAGYNPPAPLNDNIGYRMDITQYKAGVNYLFK